MAWIFVDNLSFYLHSHEILLNGLLRVNVNANFECQQGFCGTCKVKFKPLSSQYHIHYLQPPLVLLADDELLPCCCQVVGAIRLDIQQTTNE